jgi:SAM-dependent methyltransferase
MAMRTFKEYVGRIPLKEEKSHHREIRDITYLLVDAVYSQYSESGTMGPEVVGWLDGTANAQRRNATLFESGIGLNESILDVGCGVCHFYDYLKEQGWDGEYFGIDPNQRALNMVHKGVNTQCGIISDIKEGQWDWVIASGIFNIGLNEDHMKWTLNDMIPKAKKGVVFNMLKSPYQDEQYSAYVPEEIGNWLQENHSPKNIEIREGYLAEGNTTAEFTVYFYV